MRQPSMCLSAYRVQADARRIVSPRTATPSTGKSAPSFLSTLAIAWIAATASANATEPVPSAWSLNAGQEFRYMSWTGTRGFPAGGSAEAGSGAQFYAPLSVQATRQPINDTKIELLARGGYVWSRQSTPGLMGEVWKSVV